MESFLWRDPVLLITILGERVGTYFWGGAGGGGPLLIVFLGGLSLHLNHLIASRAANYDWPFGTLPFGLFGSNLDTRHLETYPRTYSGHF